VLTDDNIGFDSSDLREILKELAEDASQYNINLDGLVSRDNIPPLRREGYTTVSSGILQLNREVMIRGTTSSGLVRDGKTMKVSFLLNHNFAIYLMGRESRWL